MAVCRRCRIPPSGALPAVALARRAAATVSTSFCTTRLFPSPEGTPMTDTLTQATICRYGADDEGVHSAASADEHFNESVYFNFFDTRNKIGGILRSGNRPGLGYREYSVNLKLPGGAISFRAGREDSRENRQF